MLSKWLGLGMLVDGRFDSTKRKARAFERCRPSSDFHAVSSAGMIRGKRCRQGRLRIGVDGKP